MQHQNSVCTTVLCNFDNPNVHFIPRQKLEYKELKLKFYCLCTLLEKTVMATETQSNRNSHYLQEPFDTVLFSLAKKTLIKSIISR